LRGGAGRVRVLGQAECGREQRRLAGDQICDCMRKHGVPSFPDPSFGPGGRAISFNVRAGAFRSQSAALNLANKACAHIGTPLPLGGLVRP
jgi:hypothetical protein